MLRCISLDLARARPSLVWLTTWCLPSEFEYARRFHREIDGLRHLCGRALLRSTLLEQCDFDARGRPLKTNRYGRPILNDCPVSFNITHAGDQIWCAISSYGQVGIDVEQIHALENFPIEALEEHEQAALKVASAEQRCIRCAWTWVRKEAVVKALSTGFYMDPSAYEVDTRNGPCTQWLVRAPQGISCTWSCHDITIGPGYVGAVAVMNAPITEVLIVLPA